MELPLPAVAVAVNIAVVLPCTYRLANVPLVTDDAAVKELTDGTTVDGTFAVTFCVVVAISVVPLYVDNTTAIVPLVLFGNQS